MDTLEIDRTLQSDPYARELYSGTYPLDQIPNPLQPGRLYICNLDNSTQEGSHWCQVSSLDAPFSITYFDSFGRPPPHELVPSLHSQAQTVWYSDILIQSPLSQACGYHVLLVSLLQARGYSLVEILTQFYHAQDRDYLRNDAYARAVISTLTSLEERPLINWSDLS